MKLAPVGLAIMFFMLITGCTKTPETPKTQAEIDAEAKQDNLNTCFMFSVKAAKEGSNDAPRESPEYKEIYKAAFDVCLKHFEPKSVDAATPAPQSNGVEVPANAGRDKFGIAMTDIPAGSFLMGSCGSSSEETKKRAFLGQAPRTENCENPDANLRSEETPQHRVNIRNFQMSKTEVSLGQFKQFIAAVKRDDLLTDEFIRRNDKGDDAPVVRVSWQDTQDFIAWLNKADKGGYRLPSEAEWEYACRSDATYCGLKTEEWVQDCWHKNYRGAPSDGSAWKSGCNASNGLHSGVLRGFFGGLKTYRQQGLSKTRHDKLFDTTEPWLSFRLARTH